MVNEPENLTLKQLALLREDMQAGFASIHAELSSLVESVRAMARTQVTMQRDITQLKDRVIVLTAAIDEHPPTHA
jgi:hypothetical protein